MISQFGLHRGRIHLTLIALVTLTATPSSIAAGQANKIANNEKYRSIETLAKGLHYLESMYVDESRVEEHALVQSALKGMVDQLDPHTVLMPPKAYEQLTIDTQGKFGGVGIIVSQEKGKLIVVSPIEDTPAARAGIKSGDEIIEIDNKIVGNVKNDDAVNSMRGEPGSKLIMKIRREGVAEPIKFELVREIIKVRSVRGQSLGSGFEYIRITSFQEGTGEELANILKTAAQSQAKIKGVILDLRDNPGGLLDQAVQVSDLFIESGLIVTTLGRDKNRIEREFARKRGTYSGFPVVVLINGGSASASEIVAGALQDHERAVVMGTTSFGKGSVQTILPLPDGSALKLTIARYYTPKDRSIQAKGIKPDITVQDKPPGDSASTAKNDKNRSPQKEADLDRHIESNDLSDLAKNQGIAELVAKWPEALRTDHLLTTAFAYINSYSKMNRGSGAPQDQREKATTR